MVLIENKFTAQDSQYVFPYHHIPYIDGNGHIHLSRKLIWGMEYLCYQKHIAEKVLSLNPVSILDVGCGDGRFLGTIIGGGLNCTGIDLSEKAIAFAKAFYPDHDFSLRNVNEIRDTFDIVSVIEVLEHIPDNEINSFLRELEKRLNHNGIIIISVPTIVKPLQKKHYRHYTLELLQEQIAKSGIHLEIVNFEYIYYNPWWFRIFNRFYDNKLFSLELKPFIQFLWKRIWNKYRFASKDTGQHLVVYLNKSGKKQE